MKGFLKQLYIVT